MDKEYSKEACDKIDALEAANRNLENENANWRQKCEKLTEAVQKIEKLNAGKDCDIKWLCNQALKGGV